MRKVFDWFIQAMGVVFITITLGPCMIGLVMGSIFVFCVCVLGIDPGPDQDARAVAALKNTGTEAYVEYAPYHAMTIDASLTAFIMPKYDNHVDYTNLRAGMAGAAAELPGWHVEALSCDAYAARLNTIFPEAAFLLPADMTFDACYEDADRLAFFDQDTGLMVHLQPDTQPHADRIKVDGLTIPHNGFMYEYESHGGFHGDGETWQALIVPEKQRAAFEAALAQHADWHEGAVTPEEYGAMHSNAFFVYPDYLPDLLPASDVTFDWWLYVDDYAREHPEKEPDKDVHPYFPAVMQDTGAVFSLNWHIALYDADTGIFIYYQLDC